jgi:hypothetical protein
MGILEIVPLFGASLGVLWRSVSWGRTGGTPPTDYTIRTQPELLDSFSDAIGPRGITPRALRDFVASTVTNTPGGVPPSIPLPLPGWTTANRPSGMVGPSLGYNYDLQQLDMWDDKLGQWVNPAFTGGTVSGNVTFAGSVNFQGPVYARRLPRNCPRRTDRGRLWNNGQTVGVSQ